MIKFWEESLDSTIQNLMDPHPLGKFDKRYKKSSKKSKLTMIRQNYQLIPSRNVVDQRFLKSDWTESTTGKIYPIKAVSSLRYRLTLSSRGVDDQRILQPDWFKVF